MKFVGAHVSISGGVEKGPVNAAGIGADAMAIFTKNQRQWEAKPLTEESIVDFASQWDKQSFHLDPVAARETIESDAERMARLREAYTVIEPTALPERRGDRPNIVAFALQTSNAVGEPVYRRTGINAERRFNRACARYPSADLAQEDFLANGGPERDRRGLDPDGDGRIAVEVNPLIDGKRRSTPASPFPSPRPIPTSRPPPAPPAPMPTGSTWFDSGCPRGWSRFPTAICTPAWRSCRTSMRSWSSHGQLPRRRSTSLPCLTARPTVTPT